MPSPVGGETRCRSLSNGDQRKEGVTMDIPHPNSYPVPRGDPDLHDMYAGNETKEKGHKSRPAASRCKGN